MAVMSVFTTASDSEEIQEGTAVLVALIAGAVVLAVVVAALTGVTGASVAALTGATEATGTALADTGTTGAGTVAAVDDT
jgi:hypothetical protein